MSDIMYPKPLIDQMLAAKQSTSGLAAIATSGQLSSATGTATIAQMAPGAGFFVVKVGSNWLFAGSVVTARPTSRTDLTMISLSSDGTTPPFAIANDIALT